MHSLVHVTMVTRSLSKKTWVSRSRCEWRGDDDIATEVNSWPLDDERGILNTIAYGFMI
jgi:hypothetical protein